MTSSDNAVAHLSEGGAVVHLPAVSFPGTASPQKARDAVVNIGLIGNGAIARLVTGFCAERADRYTVVGALGLPTDVVSVGLHPVVRTLPDLLALRPGLIVECAGHCAVDSYAGAILANGVDLILVSTGSLADPGLWQRVEA